MFLIHSLFDLNFAYINMYIQRLIMQVIGFGSDKVHNIQPFIYRTIFVCSICFAICSRILNTKTFADVLHILLYICVQHAHRTMEPWNQRSFLRRSHKCARVIEFIDVSHSRFLKHVLVMFFSE